VYLRLIIADNDATFYSLQARICHRYFPSIHVTSLPYTRTSLSLISSKKAHSYPTHSWKALQTHLYRSLS